MRISHILTSEDINDVIYCFFALNLYNKKTITQWFEDINVIFSKIKSISSGHHVISYR